MKHILVIEADPQWISFMDKLLTYYNVTYQFAQITDEIFTAIDTTRPFLILLDLMIGYEGIGATNILKELKENSNSQQIPVIIMSADFQQRGRQQLLQLGAASYVRKEHLPEELKGLMENKCS